MPRYRERLKEALDVLTMPSITVISGGMAGVIGFGSALGSESSAAANFAATLTCSILAATAVIPHVIKCIVSSIADDRRRAAQQILQEPVFEVNLNALEADVAQEPANPLQGNNNAPNRASPSPSYVAAAQLGGGAVNIRTTEV